MTYFNNKIYFILCRRTLQQTFGGIAAQNIKKRRKLISRNATAV